MPAAYTRDDKICLDLERVESALRAYRATQGPFRHIVAVDIEEACAALRRARQATGSDCYTELGDRADRGRR